MSPRDSFRINTIILYLGMSLDYQCNIGGNDKLRL